MPEKRSRPDSNFFYTGETTERLDEHGRVIGVTEDHQETFFTEEHVRYRDRQGNEQGRSRDRERFWADDDVAYTRDDGERFFGETKEGFFGGGPYVEVRDESGTVVGTARMKSKLFGEDEIDVDGYVPPGLAAELLGGREDRRVTKVKKEHARRRGVSVPDDELGLVWALLKVGFMFAALVVLVMIGLFALATALVIATVAAVVQFGFAEAVRRRLGPAVRAFGRWGRRAVWVGPAVGVAVGIALVGLVASGGDALGSFVFLLGTAGGGYLSHRAAVWISTRRLGEVDAAALAAGGLVEPHPAVLYGAPVGLLVLLGVGAWGSGALGPGAASEAFGEAGIAEAPLGVWDEEGGRPTASRLAGEAPTFAPETVYANAPGDGFLALRTAPSTRTGTRIDPVPHGHPVRVMNVQPVPDVVDGRSARWLYVEYADRSGWVFDAYTLPSPPAPLPEDAEGRWATVNGLGGALNLRAWSSVTSRIETEMPNGARVYVEACRRETRVYSSGTPGRWCRLTFGGRTGWAFDAWLVRTGV